MPLWANQPGRTAHPPAPPTITVAARPAPLASRTRDTPLGGALSDAPPPALEPRKSRPALWIGPQTPRHESSNPKSCEQQCGRAGGRGAGLLTTARPVLNEMPSARDCPWHVHHPQLWAKLLHNEEDSPSKGTGRVSGRQGGCPSVQAVWRFE